MTEQEVLRKIREAIKALEDYSPPDEQAVDKVIIENTVLLVKRAHVLMSAGRPCPTCGGSGRV
ncbi:MAG: hypothetical protein KAI66_23945 [Lentisphaeria bacterium]|nr:hypothetical protein [Lentisphaeria bacterium]